MTSGAPAGAFRFGQNWRLYLDTQFAPERVQLAVESLQQLLGRESLEGLHWLDIGCGSGMFSLAAHRLGAKSLVSIDVDGDSVACCRELWEREGKPANWQVIDGSVLDRSFVDSLEPADIVYSWGVLHHTGDMWPAIRNAASRVKPGGQFAIAIYNRVEGRLGSETWHAIKKRYVEGGPAMQWIMSRGYVGYYVLSLLAKGKNPFAWFRNYREQRGMSVLTDIIDWVGGYPYEYANAGEIFRFCRDEFGFRLENLLSVNSLANNQFVFRRPAE